MGSNIPKTVKFKELLPADGCLDRASVPSTAGQLVYCVLYASKGPSRSTELTRRHSTQLASLVEFSCVASVDLEGP